MSITEETRRASYYGVIPELGRRQELVYVAVLLAKDGLTAEELTEHLVTAGEIPYFDLNFVRPRLSELKKMKILKAEGTRRSRRTDRETAVWKIREGGEFDGQEVGCGTGATT